MRVWDFPTRLVHWSLVAGQDGLRPAVHWLRARLRDGAARAHHTFASMLATWDSWGLDALSVGA